MNSLPLYNAQLEMDEDGIYVISLVDMPATEVEMVCFNEQKPLTHFAVQSEEKRLIYSVVMVADTPIYRVDGDYEYNLIFEKETIAKMAEKMLKDNTQNIFSIQHNGVILDDSAISMRELFVIDREKGIAPSFFENVADGSLIASLHILDDELWDMCKRGEFGGISIEAQLTCKKRKQHMSKITDLFKKFITAFSKIETDKGVLSFDGEELEIGMELYTEDGEVIFDGEYTTDEKVITVKDGKVSDISEIEKEKEEMKEEEAEAETADEEAEIKMAEDEVVEEEPIEEEPAYDAETEISILKEEIENIKKTLEELISTPATEPIAEEFSKITASKNKYAELGEAIRNLK